MTGSLQRHGLSAWVDCPATRGGTYTYNIACSHSYRGIDAPAANSAAIGKEGGMQDLTTNKINKALENGAILRTQEFAKDLLVRKIV